MATAIKILTIKETLIPITKTTTRTKVTMMTEREGTPIKGTPTNKATMTSMALTNKDRTGITTKRELNLERRYFAAHFANYCSVAITMPMPTTRTTRMVDTTREAMTMASTTMDTTMTSITIRMGSTPKDRAATTPRARPVEILRRTLRHSVTSP